MNRRLSVNTSLQYNSHVVSFVHLVHCSLLWCLCLRFTSNAVSWLTLLWSHLVPTGITHFDVVVVVVFVVIIDLVLVVSRMMSRARPKDTLPVADINKSVGIVPKR